MKAKYIDDNELTKIQSVMSDRAFLPFWVSLETGLRIGDVLKTRPIDIEGRTLYYVAEKTGKHGKAVLSPALARELKANAKGEWLFKGRGRQGHLTRQAAWARLKRACERAGLSPDGISPHTMRKIFAVDFFRAHGAKATREALQHASAATTEIYTLSDWATGENAKKPLCREDLPQILEELRRALTS